MSIYKNRNRRLKKIATIFHRFTGRKIDLSTYDSRRYSQQVIHFLKSCGIDFGYDYKFSWWMRGPYSCVLADDFYEINEIQRRRANEA